MKIYYQSGRKVILILHSKIKAWEEIKIYLGINSSSNLTNRIVNVRYDKMPSSQWKIKSRQQVYLLENSFS